MGRKMESLGVKLRSLREDRGMTLKEVSKETKIRQSVLSALENEDWKKLPQRIFVRGFVQAYVRAVGGDEKMVMEMFESSCPIKDEAISCPSFETKPLVTLENEKKRYGWIITLSVLILIIGGIYLLYTFFYQPKPAPVKSSRVETTVVKPVEEVREKEAESSRQGGLEKAAPAHTPVTSAPMPGKSAPSVTTSGESHPTENLKEGTAQTETGAARKDNLIITAKMETWIELKVGEKIIKEMLLKPGESFSARVEKSAELLIGNAGGIDIVFNGNKMENIGKPGQVVRLKLPVKSD